MSRFTRFDALTNARTVLLMSLSAVLLTGCTTSSSDANATAQTPQLREKVLEEVPATKAVTLGNGAKNWIVVEGVSRKDNTLSFKEVQIDGNGWLVMHPFENGKPNGDKYVASAYVQSGMNKDVEIEVFKGVATGEMFIVMLHRDVNENKVLDFVFVDDRNVMDTAVFEGSKMVAHAIPAP